MSIKEIMEGTLLQDYFLGLLKPEEMERINLLASQYPELAKEKKSYETAIEKYALQNAVEPSPAIKYNIMNLINNLVQEEGFDLDNTPVISKYSNYKNWLKIVKPVLPQIMEGDLFTRVIRQDDKVTQTLIKSKMNYPDEVHGDLHESFIILEGECECYIGNRVIRLKAGDFIDIPLHENHDVKILSTYVVAIQQRIAV